MASTLYPTDEETRMQDADTLEIMENWSKREIEEQIDRLQTALKLKEEWDAKKEDEKEEAWRQAGY